MSAHKMKMQILSWVFVDEGFGNQLLIHGEFINEPTVL